MSDPTVPFRHLQRLGDARRVLPVDEESRAE